MMMAHLIVLVKPHDAPGYNSILVWRAQHAHQQVAPIITPWFLSHNKQCPCSVSEKNYADSQWGVLLGTWHCQLAASTASGPKCWIKLEQIVSTWLSNHIISMSCQSKSLNWWVQQNWKPQNKERQIQNYKKWTPLEVASRRENGG